MPQVRTKAVEEDDKMRAGAIGNAGKVSDVSPIAAGDRRRGYGRLGPPWGSGF